MGCWATVILWTFLTLGLASSQQCPFLCDCNGRKAKCSGINSLTGFPLPDTIAHIHFAGVAVPALKAGTFGSQTETVTFSGSSIEEIQTGAFRGLTKLKSVSFTGALITRIMPCAFSDLHKGLSLAVRSSSIDDIREGAFNNIAKMKSLNVSSSLVKSLAPFAFHNISAETISFSDADFRDVHRAAFSELHDVDDLLILRTNFESLAPGSVYKPRNLKNVLIRHMSHRSALPHKTLMELREATPGDHQSFRFEESVVPCDCSTVPLLEYVQQHQGAVAPSVRCSDTNTPVVKATPEDACPGYKRESYCFTVEVTPHTCAATEQAGSSSSRGSPQRIALCPKNQNGSEKNKNMRGLGGQTGNGANWPSSQLTFLLSVFFLFLFN